MCNTFVFTIQLTHFAAEKAEETARKPRYSSSLSLSQPDLKKPNLDMSKNMNDLT
jgi:hypothetical protein